MYSLCDMLKISPVDIRTSLPTATLYFFSFIKNHPVSWFCPDTYQVILTFMWMAGYWFWAVWHWLKRKKFIIIKTLIFQSCSLMYSTCWTAALALILPKISFRNCLPALVIELRPFHSFSACLFLSLSTSPPPFSLSSFQNCAYIVTVVHVLEYIYAVVRPKLSSMYRDHRFLYVEPSSVYLHSYETIYIQYLCLYDVYLEYCFIVIYLTIHMHVKNSGLLHFHYIYDTMC